MSEPETLPEGPGPLFTSGPNPNLNACVGTNGGLLGDYAYVLGFAQAAMALLRTAIKPPRPRLPVPSFEELVDDGDVGAHVDALVYPICFSARHHVELFLKRQIARLAEVRDIDVNRTALREHRLGPLLDELKRVCDATDSTLRPRLAQIEGPTRELDAFDEEGQTFRYRRSNKKRLHLKDVSHINLGTLEVGLKRLFAATEDFDDYVDVLILEYQQGSFTSKLSRRDLVELAKALPPHSTWAGSTTFEEVKADFTQRFGLSGKDFQQAVNIILSNHSMAGLVGVELSLPHLTPELLTKVVALDLSKDELEAIPVDVWRVLDAVSDVGWPYEYPELFNRIMSATSGQASPPKRSRPSQQVKASPGPAGAQERKEPQRHPDWGKLEYLDDDEEDKQGIEQGDEQRRPREPSPPDVLRTMLRVRSRFINGLEKLRQPTLLTAHEKGEAARVNDADDGLDKFEAMVRQWYYSDMLRGTPKY